jgi:hypothetical protein
VGQALRLTLKLVRTPNQAAKERRRAGWRWGKVIMNGTFVYSLAQPLPRKVDKQVESRAFILHRS